MFLQTQKLLTLTFLTKVLKLQPNNINDLVLLRIEQILSETNAALV